MLNPKSPNGATAWDYGDAIAHGLQEILEAVRNGRGDDPLIMRRPWTITTDAAGYGQVEIPIPRGINFELNGVAFAGSATGYVATYVNEENPMTLLKVNASAPLVSDDFSDCYLTSDDRSIVIVARGQAASTIVSGNIRWKQYETNTSEPGQAYG